MNNCYRSGVESLQMKRKCGTYYVIKNKNEHLENLINFYYEQYTYINSLHIFLVTASFYCKSLMKTLLMYLVQMNILIRFQNLNRKRRWYFLKAKTINLNVDSEPFFICHLVNKIIAEVSTINSDIFLILKCSRQRNQFYSMYIVIDKVATLNSFRIRRRNYSIPALH